MDNVNPSQQSGGDGRQGARSSARRPSAPRFAWCAPSPSSEEIGKLEELYPSIIQLPSEAIDQEISDWIATGLIVRSIARWVPPEASIREFRRVGIAGRISSISLSHRTVLMKFETSDARDAVLNQPWVVNGQPLAAEAWRPDFVPADDALSSALLWIRLPSLPIEYWSDEALSSILSVAGQFVAADDSTREKRRGSFARACVRVDLIRPLRPGARIRGHGSPFWQQFAYEHVEGICYLCGSIHLSGPCSSSQAPEASSLMPRFGPWMAAIRQRIPSPMAASGSKVSSPSSSDRVKPASQNPVDGWRTPGKTSRRRAVDPGTVRNVVVVGESSSVDLGHSADAGTSSASAKVSPCQSLFSVPVTVASPELLFKPPPRKNYSSGMADSAPRKNSQASASCPQGNGLKSVFNFTASGSSQGKKIQISSPGTVVQGEGPSSESDGFKDLGPNVASNPFGLRGSDRWSGVSKIRDDPNPASLKRARSIDGGGLSVVPNPAKGKGRGREGNLRASSKGTTHGSHLVPASRCDHDSAVIMLKEAILPSSPVPRELDVPIPDRSGIHDMELSLQSGPTDQGMVAGNSADAQGSLQPLSVDSIDMDSVGSQSGVQCTPPTV